MQHSYPQVLHRKVANVTISQKVREWQNHIINSYPQVLHREVANVTITPKYF